MMRRTKADAAATREQLLKAGLTVFSRKGYTASTMEDIAKQAEVTRGAIYWHFGSKAELYAALINSYAGLSGSIVQQSVSEGGSLLEVLERILTHLLAAVETDALLKEVMELTQYKTERVSELEPVFQKLIESAEQLLKGITDVFQDGINQGLIRNDVQAVDVARAYLAYQNGITSLWLSNPSAFSIKEKASNFARIFIDGIRIR
jgi:TetR/AcrR family transcriptional regulator, acrAB operon repressor